MRRDHTTQLLCSLLMNKEAARCSLYPSPTALLVDHRAVEQFTELGIIYIYLTGCCIPRQQHDLLHTSTTTNDMNTAVLDWVKIKDEMNLG